MSLFTCKQGASDLAACSQSIFFKFQKKWTDWQLAVSGRACTFWVRQDTHTDSHGRMGILGLVTVHRTSARQLFWVLPYTAHLKTCPTARGNSITLEKFIYAINIWLRIDSSVGVNLFSTGNGTTWVWVQDSWIIWVLFESSIYTPKSRICCKHYYKPC